MIVFVHGILSSGSSAWGQPSWPDLLADEPEFDSIGIYIFTYQTSLRSRTYGIADVAESLREHLRLKNLLSMRKIVFVCHSMGGIVVRRYLVASQRELIAKKLKIGLFLVASPSLGSRDANMLSALSFALQHTQAAVLRFSQANTSLDELHRDFRTLLAGGELSIEGRELTEDRPIAIKRRFCLRRQVVEPFSAAQYFTRPGCEPLRVPDSDHASIVKPLRNDAIQHLVLKEFISERVIGSNVADVHVDSAPPPTITHAVNRPGIIAAASTLLLQEVPGRAIVVIVLHGFPGAGKTALAAQLCHDERVRGAFPDGVVWVGVGRDAMAPVHTVLRALGEGSVGVQSSERARAALLGRLATKSVLVVLDDIWWYEQVAPFIVDAPHSRLLVTSRARIVGPELGARQLEVSAMTGPEAAELLGNWAGRSDPSFPHIAERLHRLPIALRIAGALLARQENATAWLERLRSVSQLLTSSHAVGDRERDLNACLELSVLELAHKQANPPQPDDRPLFEALGIFPQDVAIPCTIVERLWSSLEPGRRSEAWSNLLTELDELGLIDRADEAIKLHDILLDYCRFRLGLRERALQESLLRSYKPIATAAWSSVPDDGYLYDHLAYHLIAARGREALAELLRQEDPPDCGRNAWYEAREGRGQLSGYAANVEAAQHSCTTVACEARFGLMLASLRSRVGNAPPALLLALVKQGVWPVERAAAYARGLVEPADSIEALLLLGEQGARDLLLEAREMLHTVSPGEGRDRLAQRVAQASDAEGALHAAACIADPDVLSDTLSEVLPVPDGPELSPDADNALGRLDPEKRIRVLCALVRRAEGDRSAIVSRALRELRTMGCEHIADAYARISAGAPLIPYLMDEDRTAFFECAFSTLSSEVALGVLPTNLLGRLAPYLSGEWAKKAFALVHDSRAKGCERGRIGFVKDEAEAFLLLRESLSPQLRIEAANHLLNEPVHPLDIGEVFAACVELDPARSDGMIIAALAMLRGLKNQSSGVGHLISGALYQLRKHITGEHLGEALNIAEEITEEDYRYQSLLTLANSCEEPKTLATVLREARRLSKETKFELQGLERRCRVTAVVLPRLTKERRRSELAELLATLDARDAGGSLVLSWESRMQLLPFMEEAENAEETIKRMASAILTRDANELAAFADRLPQRFHNLVLDQALDHGEVGPRRQLLAALAPRLTAESVHRVTERFNSIGDAAVQAEASASLRAVSETAGDASGETLELLLLEEISKDLGSRLEEDVGWVHRLVARRLAQGGQSDRALAVLRRLPPHRALYSYALADTARYLSQEMIHAEVKQRIAAASDGNLDDFARGQPQNLVPLLRHAEAATRLAIREMTLPHNANEYGRIAHYANFVPALPDDRTDVIRRFMHHLDDRPRPDEMKIVELLVPYADSEDLSRLAAAVDRGASDDESTAGAALAIAARDSGRLAWALATLGRLDKPYRARCTALHADAFSDRERAILSIETLPYARGWSRQQRSVRPLCLATLVAPDESSREEILREALTMAVKFSSSLKVRSELSIIAAYLCLLLNGRCQLLVCKAVKLASGRFREFLLRTLEGLRFPIRSCATLGDMAEIDQAITDCSRWWP